MEPLKMNQVWKPKCLYGIGFVVTEVNKAFARMKVDGYEDAEATIELSQDDLSEFLSMHELMSYDPAYPVEE